MKMICPQCGAPLSKTADAYQCTYCGYQQELEKPKDYRKISYEQRSGELAAERTAARRHKLAVAGAILLAIAILGIFVRNAESQRIEIDPWKYAVIDVSGMDGLGKITVLQHSTEDVPANSIYYSASKTKNLSNGEVIRIDAKSSEFNLTSDSIAYTIEGLQTYELNLDSLTELQLDTIQEKSLARLRSMGTGTNGSPENVHRVRMYTMSSKTGNTVFDVYAGDFLLADGGFRTLYMVVYYTNFVVNDGDDVSMRYFEQMYTGSIISVGTWRDGVITGYETLDDVDTAMHMALDNNEILTSRSF